MSSNFSRRSFLNGFLGAVSAFLGGKAAAAPAAPPAPALPAPPLPPPAYTVIDALGTRTTVVYDLDECSKRLAAAEALGRVTTCTYDVGRLNPLDQPPAPPAHGPSDGGPKGRSPAATARGRQSRRTNAEPATNLPQRTGPRRSRLFRAQTEAARGWACSHPRTSPLRRPDSGCPRRIAPGSSSWPSASSSCPWIPGGAAATPTPD